MYKRLAIVLTLVLFAAASFLAAEAKLVEVSATELQIVFTYDNPDAGAVTVAGSFQGWDPAKTNMTKGDDGLWTYTLKGVKVRDKIQYKFVVDGAWTTDPTAPALIDDGYEGKNGLIEVQKMASQAVLDAAGIGAAAAATTGAAVDAVEVGVKFGAYSTLSSDSKFLTRDLATGEVSGLEFDQQSFTAQSYWKFLGQATEDLKLDFQIQAFAGSLSLFRSNSLATDNEFVTLMDGLQSTGNLFFGPFTSINGGPLSINRLKAAIETPIVNLATGYGEAISAGKSLIYNVINGANGGAGYLEISLGKDLQTIDVIKLGALIGLSKAKGGYGMYSFVEAKIEDAATIVLSFTTHSPKTELFRYYEDNASALSLGAEIKAGSELTIKVHGLMSFDTNDADNDEATTGVIDQLAGALSVGLNLGAYTATLNAKIAGTNPYTVWGDDDSLNKNNLYFELNQLLKIEDILRIGLDANLKFADLENMADGWMNIYLKPYVDVAFKPIIDFDLTTKFYTKIYLDKVAKATDADQPFGAKVGDVGAQVVLNGLGDTLERISLDYGLNFATGDWDAVDNEWPLNDVYNTFGLNFGFAGNVSANLGVILRSDVATPEDLSNVPLGFSLGGSWIVPVDVGVAPTLWGRLTYNTAPYNDNSASFKMSDFRFDSLTGGAGEAHFSAGLVWSF